MEVILLPRLAPVNFFPWTFFGYLLGFGVVTILFLFYFSRGLAYVLSLLVEGYLWHYYRSSITIEAIQVSPLAGRIFVRNIRYCARNEVIKIAGCYITWKYWSRHVLKSELFDTGLDRSSDGEKAAETQTNSTGKHPHFLARLSGSVSPRVVLDVRGLEWFVFNRSPAYDAVLEAITRSANRSQHPRPKVPEQSARVNPSTIHPSVGLNITSVSEEKDYARRSSPPLASVDTQNTLEQTYIEPDLPSFLRFFPIGVVCKKAAMVMGNDFTQSILVATASEAEGFIDARASAPEDNYKQCFDFVLEDLAIKFRKNEDYREDILRAGAGQTFDDTMTKAYTRTRTTARARHTILHAIRDLMPRLRGSVESLLAQKADDVGPNSTAHIPKTQAKWLGLSRYLDANEDELQGHERWKSVEYAQVTTIVESPKVAVSFFWDVPGRVQAQVLGNLMETDHVPLNHINGGAAPEWGFDINIGGGTINYGPWADRQRANLQSIFFPSSHTTAVPASALQPGQQRQSTQFKLIITLDDAVVLRIHTREESKDWRWKSSVDTATKAEASYGKKADRKKHAKAVSDTEIRPSGWLYLTAAANTSITYKMDMLASEEGFGNSLQVDIPSVNLTTSVNHGLFLRSQAMVMNCDLSNPLQWNAFRSWNFNITASDLEMFLLRDHIFLLIDLISDWTSGPPNDFMTFIPLLYKFNLDFHNLKAHLNVNDANIVDVPASPQENSYLLFGAQHLRSVVDVPVVNYKPQRNAVAFDANLDNLYLDLLSPTWNTLSSLLRQKTVGKVSNLLLKGCYDYWTTNSPAQTDILTLDLHGNSLVLHVYGFLIRQFMAFRENFFGDDMHFQTLEEYQQKIASTGIDIGTRNDHSSAKISNDLDVILTIRTMDSCLLLPSEIYSAEEHIRADIPSIGLDLRFTNYYMDLDVSSSPISFTKGTMSASEVISDVSLSNTQMFLDGLWISGHRLFGLPPTEPTYVCNWDFTTGSMVGECSLDFFATLATAGRAIAFQFRDIENVLPRNQAKTIHDATFLRVKLGEINLWLRVEDSAIQFRAVEASVTLHDLAGRRFSESIQAQFPDISIAIIDTNSTSRQLKHHKPNTITHALLQTSIVVRMIETGAQFRTQRRLQQDYIFVHDSRTHRTPWLLLKDEDGMGVSGRDYLIPPKPPAMPIPPMAEPVGTSASDHLSFSTATKSNTSPPVSKRLPSSFLSRVPTSDTMKPSPSRSKSRPQIDPKVAKRSMSMPAVHDSTRLSKLTFSSSYDLPYFPLQGIEADRIELPEFNHQSRTLHNLRPTEEYLDTEVDGVLKSNLMISLESGIVAFLTPEALKCIGKVMQAMQPTTPSQILDDIQMSALPRVPLGFNRPKAVKSTHVRLDLPQIALRLLTKSFVSEAPIERQTYELRASNLTLMTGISSGKYPKKPSSGSLAVHVSMKILQLAVRGQQRDSSDDEAHIQLNIASTEGWLYTDEDFTGRVVTEHFEIASLNRKVEYLSAIVNNAVNLAEQVLPQFVQAAHELQVKEQAVVHYLSGLHNDLADPIFLNNASYIARATTEHARNSDTWKIISRLRYILYNLLHIEYEELKEMIAIPKTELTHSQVDEVIGSFNQWRGWDLEYLRSSAFMTQVFKSTPSQEANASTQKTIKLSLDLTDFVFIIDPGPSQNQIQLQGIAFQAHSNMKSITSSSKFVRTSTVTFFCSETIVHLNWEILDFVEGIMQRLSNQNSNEFDDSATIIELAAIPAKDTEHIVQVVTVFETVDAHFNTINLEVTSLTRSIRLSTIIGQSGSEISSANMVVNAEFSVTRISSRSQLALVIQLLEPFVQGSIAEDTQINQILRTFNGGGFCRKLELEVRQDLLGLLGVADVLLRDEIAYIQSLSAIMKPHSESQPRAKIPLVQTRVRNVFHAALLLVDYRVSVALLSSLHYVLHGHIVRSTVQSSAGQQVGLNSTFDVKQHVHTFENHNGDIVEEVSSFDLPPITGGILVTSYESFLRLAMSISLETISLDASAIHALTSTFSRREVSSYQQSVMRDISILKSNMRSLFPKKDPPVPSEDSQSSLLLLYKASIAVEGLSVTATTAKTTKQAARLVVGIGPVSVNLKNETNERGTQLDFVDLRADANEIKVLLERFTGHYFNNCGDVVLGFSLHAGSAENDFGKIVRSVEVTAIGPEINMYAETAPTIVDILGYIQQRFRDFRLSDEIHTLRARRNRSKSIAQDPISNDGVVGEGDAPAASIFNSMFTIDLQGLQVAWRVGELQPISPGHDVEDLIFSIERTTLATRHVDSAKLVMANLQLQMVPTSQSAKLRSRNSALMPEVVFKVAYVSTSEDRRFAFQAVGKSVDLRLTPRFVLPAADLQRSIALATEDLRKVIADWNSSFMQDEQSKKLIAAKKISSILIDADFAGAVVNLHAGGDLRSPTSPYSPSNIDQHANGIDQIIEHGRTSAVLRTPGIAFKVEYSDLSKDSRALSAEVKIDASSNTLQPSIVPLILELTKSVREVVHEKDNGPSNAIQKKSPSTSNDELISNPVAILGDCKLNLGLRICRQKFGLSCQPIAKVEARAQFEDIYITVNTVQANEQDRFFTASAKIQNLQASVQHTYSQEATGRFVAKNIELSLMNSRHVSELRGISAILSFGPMTVLLNVRQLHDFLLFREIWLPEELQQPQSSPVSLEPVSEPQGYVMQRYQEVAIANPFPWTATIAIVEVNVELDFGQSLGRSSFQITKFWTASRKISNWEQNLHLGFERIKLDCVGRLNCYLGLENMALRTSIKWPQSNQSSQQVPLVQASMAFDDFKVKAAFEYQTFLIAKFSSLKFFMYNVRDDVKGKDRLVCTVDGEKVQAYCTTQSSAIAIGLHQAIQRLIQEKKQSFENSLREIQRYYRRSKTDASNLTISQEALAILASPSDDTDKTPLQLQTNVVITLKLLNVGTYPRSFADSTIFKLDALDAQAKFSVAVRDSTLQTSLGMSLGQVRVALSNINQSVNVSSFEEVSVEEIVQNSTSSRGGTILKVPRVHAGMQTWQVIGSTMVDYTFRSFFEGKVEVGWNINRINVIRNMVNVHSKALAARLGKALPQPAVQITGVPTEDADGKGEQDKITAVVSVPLSKYNYTALEPPIIETPQLRDMGEATPPLEWIGLHRDRLPNLTHQIIIVPLLEIAKEVEDAYGTILGVY